MSGLLTILVAASAALGQSEPTSWSLPKEAAEELRKFEGQWTVTGEVTGMSLQGKWSGRRAPGGHCVTYQYQLTLDGHPIQGSGIAGWDSATSELFTLAAYSDGFLEQTRYKRAAPGILEGTYRGSAQGKPFEAKCALQSKGPDEWTFSTKGLTGTEKPGELAVRFTRAGREARAVPPPGPSYEHLKFLDFSIGRWRLEGVLPDSGKYVGEESNEWILNKNVIRTRGRGKMDDGKAVEYELLTGWDPAKKMVVMWIAGSDGVRSQREGTYDPKKKRLTSRQTAVDAQGVESSGTVEEHYIDNDTFLLKFTDQMKGKERQPDAEVNATRIRP